jgi:hypothetical protein
MKALPFVIGQLLTYLSDLELQQVEARKQERAFAVKRAMGVYVHGVEERANQDELKALAKEIEEAQELFTHLQARLKP